MTKRGRKRIGQPLSVTFTDEQAAFIDSLIPPGGTRTEVIRRVVQLTIDLGLLNQDRRHSLKSS